MGLDFLPFVSFGIPHGMYETGAFAETKINLVKLNLGIVDVNFKKRLNQKMEFYEKSFLKKLPDLSPIENCFPNQVFSGRKILNNNYKANTLCDSVDTSPTSETTKSCPSSFDMFKSLSYKTLGEPDTIFFKKNSVFNKLSFSLRMMRSKQKNLIMNT